MKIFIDTSAFYALASKNDSFHYDATVKYEKLIMQYTLLTTSYVIVETVALLHNRGGQETACNFLNSIEDVVKIVWVPEGLHGLGKKLYLKGNTSVSFVDCISFASMRHYGINIFFGFDKHFTEHGFKQF